MKIGVVGSCLAGHKFTDFLTISKEIGFEVFEISLFPGSHQGTLNLAPENIAAVKEQIQAGGLEVYAIGGYNDFVQPDEEKMAAEIQQVKSFCDLAVHLNCNVVRVFGGEPKEEISKDQWADLIIQGFKACVDYAKSKKVYLAIENHGWITNDADVELKIIEAVGSDWLRLTVDTSNFRWFGQDLDTIRGYYERLAPYTIHTHIKDGTAKGGYLDKYLALAVGEGELDIKFFIQQLQARGYSRPLCIEYEGREDPVIGLRKSYQYLSRLLQQV